MRKAVLRRTTTETDIRIALNLDGQGRAKISTGIPFLDHMLTLVARHGAMDLELTASPHDAAAHLVAEARRTLPIYSDDHSRAALCTSLPCFSLLQSWRPWLRLD